MQEPCRGRRRALPGEGPRGPWQWRPRKASTAILRPALPGTDHRRGCGLVTEADAPALQVVRRHFDHHLVADAGTDAELAHLAGRVGQHLMIIVELHAEI